MRLFIVFVLFVLALAGAVSAQTNNGLVNKGYQVADSIARLAPRLTPIQASRVDQLLNEINQTLVGTTPGTPHLTCASRDNDGMRPFIINLERNPANIVRIPTLAFDTESECHDSLSSVRFYQWQNFALICSSRDNDGRDPWKVSRIDMNAGTAVALARAVASTKNECFQQLADMREYQDGLSMCVSRDGDGRDPWKLVMFYFNGTVSTRPEDFSSYSECRKKL